MKKVQNAKKNSTRGVAHVSENAKIICKIVVDKTKVMPKKKIKQVNLHLRNIVNAKGIGKAFSQNLSTSAIKIDNVETCVSTKSIIICDDDKVKGYTELIKNSNMRPIAVTSKKNIRVQKKLTAKTIALCIMVGLILGFVNGFLGGGGGMLCVPLLVFTMGLTDKRAHATAILVMLPISLASFAVYACNMRIEWGLALWVVIGSVVGGFVGSILLKKLSNSWLRAIFALIMIGAGIKTIL